MKITNNKQQDSVDAEWVDISNVKSATSDESKNNSHKKKNGNNDDELITKKRQVNNPFFSPIAILFSKVVSIKWSFPYIPQTIELLVLLISICIMLFLYVTVDIVSQIESVLMNLVIDTEKGMKEESAIEKSAYAVITGVYIVFWFPFWIALLPFNIIGWCWKNLGYFMFVLVVLLILLFYFMESSIFFKIC